MKINFSGLRGKQFCMNFLEVLFHDCKAFKKIRLILFFDMQSWKKFIRIFRKFYQKRKLLHSKPVKDQVARKTIFKTR